MKYRVGNLSVYPDFFEWEFINYEINFHDWFKENYSVWDSYDGFETVYYFVVIKDKPIYYKITRSVYIEDYTGLYDGGEFCENIFHFNEIEKSELDDEAKQNLKWMV